MKTAKKSILAVIAIVIVISLMPICSLRYNNIKKTSEDETRIMAEQVINEAKDDVRTNLLFGTAIFIGCLFMIFSSANKGNMSRALVIFTVAGAYFVLLTSNIQAIKTRVDHNPYVKTYVEQNQGEKQ